MSNARDIVQKLWSYCSILRDDGLSYPDYVEQLTYLLFLKMAHETATAPGGADIVPNGMDWPSLVERRGDDLHRHYGEILKALGASDGMLGLIFRDSRNKIKDPHKLRLLVADLIDARHWSALDVDVKGDAYEGLLEKNAQDTKSGAGQYFTPRPVVDAIVECIDPKPGEKIFDPACGTGGFLISAARHVRMRNPNLTPAEEEHLCLHAIRGGELVGEVTRLAAMNLLLHGIGPNAGTAEPPVATQDSLAGPPKELYDVIITNPPFGKRSSVTLVTKAKEGDDERRRVLRDDLWVSTSNKELNFLQHVAVSLSQGGRAAIVVPDGVLSGLGAGSAIRRRLLETFDVHTLLRLPAGIFYAAGVNANVLFFDHKSIGQGSRRGRLWVYDLRTDKRFTLVGHRLSATDLTEFTKLYEPADRSKREDSWAEDLVGGRWRSFSVDDILKREDCSLDLFWLPAQGNAMASQNFDEIVGDIVADLQFALAEAAKLMPGDERRKEER
ncbi:class I SAM-dependent DNA methyltransferase [Solwaraspora sp. WMMD1047]|uniref:class I SAM-dependent DNA methyltransferase n=1 Tax=Solwaraspora sp. WMMD1047 TaxID=3016102 RepID=UPI00241602E0|nr:class I SAM-dependent DNA methyltransferase [Solwaraspora sp. WMMD1047]MDG4829274.1 class I SAM-dependent DNA methyltransferase [Solwaraspora sp. WMMD1047]